MNKNTLITLDIAVMDILRALDGGRVGGVEFASNDPNLVLWRFYCSGLVISKAIPVADLLLSLDDFYELHLRRMTDSFRENNEDIAAYRHDCKSEDLIRACMHWSKE
jgi:hypothetical protein